MYDLYFKLGYCMDFSTAPILYNVHVSVLHIKRIEVND